MVETVAADVEPATECSGRAGGRECPAGLVSNENLRTLEKRAGTARGNAVEHHDTDRGVPLTEPAPEGEIDRYCFLLHAVRAVEPDPAREAGKRAVALQLARAPLKRGARRLGPSLRQGLLGRRHANRQTHLFDETERGDPQSTATQELPLEGSQTCESHGIDGFDHTSGERAELHLVCDFRVHAAAGIRRRMPKLVNQAGFECEARACTGAVGAFQLILEFGHRAWHGDMPAGQLIEQSAQLGDDRPKIGMVEPAPLAERLVQHRLAHRPRENRLGRVGLVRPLPERGDTRQQQHLGARRSAKRPSDRLARVQVWNEDRQAR